MTKLARINRTILTLLLVAAASLVQGQTYPSRPITMIRPQPPGAASDSAARVVAAEMSRLLGQPIVFENRAGANGMIGLSAVRQAKDPYTLGVVNNGMLVLVPLASKIYRLEPLKDYVPVSMIFYGSAVLAASPAVPFRDLKGLIEYAKANPGKLNVATSGTASPSALAYELLRYQADVNLTNIPYKAGGQSIPEMLEGTVHLQFGGTEMKPFIDAGKLVAIAVTGKVRSRVFPDTPTMMESGLEKYTVQVVWGIVAPPGTPREVAGRLSAVAIAALKEPSVRKILEDNNFEPQGSSPDDYTASIRAEFEYLEPVVRAAKISID